MAVNFIDTSSGNDRAYLKKEKKPIISEIPL